MIVVDTSVWIGHMRDTNSRATRKLRELDSPETIVVGDIILMELLQGARDERHSALIEESMRAYEQAPMLGIKNSIQTARNYRKMLSLGITPRKASDLIIATFCIANRYALLHDDQVFEPMAQHLGLKTI